MATTPVSTSRGMPDDAFRGAFKAMFTFALPVLLGVQRAGARAGEHGDVAGGLLVLLGLGVVWR